MQRKSRESTLPFTVGGRRRPTSSLPSGSAWRLARQPRVSLAVAVLGVLGVPGVPAQAWTATPGQALGARPPVGLDRASDLYPARVDGTTSRSAYTLVHIHTEHGELVATPEHPFLRAGGVWVHASQLRAGDQLTAFSIPGRPTAVLAVSTERGSKVPVYNLTVSRSHTYTVGPDAVLVHNTCGQDRGKGKLDDDPKALARARWKEQKAELRRERRAMLDRGRVQRSQQRLENQRWQAENRARFERHEAAQKNIDALRAQSDAAATALAEAKDGAKAAPYSDKLEWTRKLKRAKKAAASAKSAYEAAAESEAKRWAAEMDALWAGSEEARVAAETEAKRLGDLATAEALEPPRVRRPWWKFWKR